MYIFFFFFDIPFSNCSVLSWNLQFIIAYHFIPPGTENRLAESLSLIDAVMPEVVASRQNQQNQQKQAVKVENPGIVPSGSTPGGPGSSGSATPGANNPQTTPNPSGPGAGEQNGEEGAGGNTANAGVAQASTPAPDSMEVVVHYVVYSIETLYHPFYSSCILVLLCIYWALM